MSTQNSTETYRPHLDRMSNRIDNIIKMQRLIKLKTSVTCKNLKYYNFPLYVKISLFTLNLYQYTKLENDHTHTKIELIFFPI